MKTAVVLNMADGTGNRQRVTELLRRFCPDAELHEANDGPAVPHLIWRAVDHGCTLVVARRGDGTIRAVAQELVGSAALGVLPLGTRNHFAPALGMPLDLEPAVRLLGNGQVRQADVGEINGTVFLLYAALGFVPCLCESGSGHETGGHRHTSLPFFGALMAVMRRYRSLHVRIQTDAVCLTPIRAPLVDRELRAQVVVAKGAVGFRRVHVAGQGHERWVDGAAGFAAAEQNVLL